ncbi:DUF421 domain-containing protein [Neobacillus massiliamazoniensis]|uniref:DUF421 domain-containing protein n=1 Tax=Neobacillus massiliamazoniensis TaxID=1499688 RepID=UPI001FDF5FFF|nr:DUF421 domain-containing protein [Neobacillus massiliamazoniensis]
MWISIVRTVVSFFILMIVSLWMGRRVNSKNTHHNFAIAVIIGSFISNMGFDYNLSFFPMLVAFISLIVIYFLLSIISTKSRRFRLWLSGQPTVVIENGKLLDENMKKIMYTIDDLNQQLREQGIFNIFEVEFALVEVSGKLSIMKKKDYQNVIQKDINPSNPSKKLTLPIELIMDRIPVEKNFNTQYSWKWLEEELKKRNLKMTDIQYAVISSNGSLFIDLFDDKIKR